MSNFDRECVADNGFNFSAEARTIVGYITYLKIGDTELTNYFNELTDPENQTGQIKASVVLDSFTWTGNKKDPLQFSGYVSAGDRGLILDYLDNPEKTEVQFTVVIYSYDGSGDSGAGCYYQSLHTNGGKYKGRLEVTGGEKNLSVAAEESFDSPKAFYFNMGLVPPENADAQDIHYANSSTLKKARQWGLKVG